MTIDDHLVTIMPPDHPLSIKKALSPQDLEGQDIIMHEYDSIPYVLVRSYLETNRVKVKTSFEFSSNAAIKNAVLNGLGLAVLSRITVEEEVAAGALCVVPFLNNSLIRKFYVIQHRGTHLSRPAKQFIALLESSYNPTVDS